MQSSGTSEPWRIGVLFSYTGTMAVIEETQLRGTLMAVEEINDAGGVNGRPIQPVIYDPCSDPKFCGLYAKKLMVEDGVTTIFGCYTSSSRKAVLPVVERLDGLLWYPTLYEGFECSPNVIYTGATPNQNSLELCRMLMEHFGSRFYFVGSDYVYPRCSNRIMRELVVNSGGSIVGEHYLPLNADRSDFQPTIRDIAKVKPDVIFSTVVGDATIPFYQAYADAGLNPKVMPIASLTTSETEVRAMGYDVAEGHLTAASYFQAVENEKNASFVQRYHRRYGADEPTNMCVEAAYFQVKAFAETLAQTNSMNTTVLRNCAMGIAFDAPQGSVSINREWGHTDLWTRIGRVNHQGQFDIIYQSPDCVDSDPYLVGYGRSLELR
ncbi:MULTISPECIES: transporter substrate-binding domain-containing protein [unclassified Mameliella]|uniref:transporter substrate-binding domain-containing protein n=1 Tax=Mameliella sp. LZ-28 TaxID=2484146 RepID=UPI00143F1887|nr:transporter substrate-binding domain-containing protein [Mameliella sp. LZ-28]